MYLKVAVTLFIFSYAEAQFFIPSSSFVPGSDTGPKPFLVSPSSNLDGSGVSSSSGTSRPVVVSAGQLDINSGVNNAFISQSGSNAGGQSNFGGSSFSSVSNSGSGASFGSGDSFFSSSQTSRQASSQRNRPSIIITTGGSSTSSDNVLPNSGNIVSGPSIFVDAGRTGSAVNPGSSIVQGSNLSTGQASSSGNVVSSGISAGIVSGNNEFGSSTTGGFIGSTNNADGSGIGFSTGVDGLSNVGAFASSGPRIIVSQGQTGQSSGTIQGNQNFRELFNQVTVTIRETSTIDRFITVTETVLNSVPVTITGFSVNTVTVTTRGVHQTSVDDIVAVTSTIVERPVTEFVTTEKSNHIYVTEVSVDLFTITHNSQLIEQTTFTTVVTQTLTISSPIVRTSITTSVQTSTAYQTIVNTVFAHGYN